MVTTHSLERIWSLFADDKEANLMKVKEVIESWVDIISIFKFFSDLQSISFHASRF